MGTNTPRFALPNLVVSQAHKEITHNEALAIIDSALHAAIVNSASAPPILVEEDAGKCWLVVAPATGTWSGKEDAVAVWTGSGWRFLDPVPGMTVWSVQDSSELRYSAGQWIPPVTIIAPTGGAVVDTEARIALNALLGHLANIGLVAN
ncbi:MAG TPA: DUF2793 domain-containing protein [Sphingorhabdus sp.]|jgi:hypothetical protein|nr:DUF2793 domain-containing protein [Sphingorhabdus sp.]HMU21125.1 DUF2793 domain-containing protein [Sphingorhabdus sp.]